MNLHKPLKTFVAACMVLFAASSTAQTWPVKPIRLVVSFAPGGPTDVVARLIGEKFQAAWGQPVVVDNRIGAGGTIGSAFIAKSAPDGYTLNLEASSHVYNGALFSNLPYDPIRDFTLIARVSYYPLMLITHPSLPANNVGELVAFGKSNPGNFAGKISNETAAVLEMQDIRKALAGLGLEPAYSSAEQLGASMRFDLEKYSKLIRDADIKMN